MKNRAFKVTKIATMESIGADMNDTPKIYRQSVRWADGTFDAKRTCDECGLDTCTYPVHKDYYPEIVTSKTYWNWMEENEETENE